MKLQVQYSPFITSHMRDILGVAPRNFSRGKSKIYVWDWSLPRRGTRRVERDCHSMTMQHVESSDYHAWNYCLVWLIQVVLANALLKFCLSNTI